MGDVADDVLLISESPPRLKSSNLPRQIPDLKQATKIESNYATPNSRVGNGQPQYRDLAEQIKSNPRKPLKKRIYKSPKKTFCRFVLKLLFSHIGLCLIVGGYAAFGAWLFIQIELDDEQTRKQLKDDKIIEVNETINYLADVFWYYLDKNFTYKDWTSMVSR